jgi:GDP-mannose 6-dehydrogenase
LIERLIGKGLRLKIYDRDVEMARISGANKEFIEREIPHISSLMHNNLEAVIESSEVLIIGKKDAEFRELYARVKPGCVVIDLVRMFEQRTEQAGYEGICW